MMKSIRLFFTLIFSIITIQNVYSQQLNFSHFSSEKGLSQSVINCIYQDKKGFIWIGTQNGLNKFDGYRFENFVNNPSDNNSISSNWIYAITEDSVGNLWIGTKDGLNKFDQKTGLFTLIDFKPHNSALYFNNSVYGLTTGADGNILINTTPFLNIYNPYTNESKSFKSPLEADAAVGDQNIPIIQGKNKLIWIGSTKGLSCFNIVTQKFTVYKNETENLNSLINNNITALFEDNRQNIWIGTENGLNRLNIFNNNIKHFSNTPNQTSGLSRNFIRAVLQDFQGNLWVGTEQGGLNKMINTNSDFPIFEVYTKSNSNLSNDNVCSLWLDKSKNLWIGTLDRLNKVDLKAKKFTLWRKDSTANSLKLIDNVIASIYKGRDGKIWVGNWGQGLNIIDRKTRNVEHFSSGKEGNNRIINDFVHVIFEDTKNRIWIGTRNGTEIFDKEEHKFVPYFEFLKSDKLPTFENHRIYCIIQDQKENYWIGTQRGLYKLNLQKNTFSHYTSDNKTEPKLSGNLIYIIREDRDGLIWIGTSTGLDCFDPKTEKFTHFLHDPKNKNSLCDNFVVSLCEDFDGRIWIGTQSFVNEYDKKTKKFTYYNQENGLPGNLVYEILEDNNKNLWFASGNGLAVFNRKKKMFRTYSVEEGLQSNEFNLRACFKSPDGEVFFGGMNGFNSFYPDSLKDNNYIPPIVITSLEKIKAGQKITLHTESLKEISLNYDDYVFTITFAALDFTNPDKNQYAYKMEGLMEDWVEIGNRNFIPFSNIPPGKYILKVKGTNNDGVWNETGTQIRITIRPPWWRSNLAYGIYIIGIVLAIFAFIKIRERNLIKERNILEKKVKKRTIEIEQQKEKIEKAHREITDSINYASRIQTAMLPQCEEFDKNFSDNFIIYKPKDVVSGDFYWINKIKNTTLFAVADCTGHGVPGAFVSMLGISLLNEITNFDDVQHPHQVLEELRRYIKKSLKQIDDVAATKDGMDIAFCAYDTQTHILEYSGANNSIYLIRENYGKNELTELKATKNPIGIYHVEIPFELRSTEILPGDKLYLFSDGFVDQFSENNEKYKIIRLKNKLSEISHLPMNEQKDILEDTFTKWKGANLQIDDVLVVGIQF